LRAEREIHERDVERARGDERRGAGDRCGRLRLASPKFGIARNERTQIGIVFDDQEGDGMHGAKRRSKRQAVSAHGAWPGNAPETRHVPGRRRVRVSSVKRAMFQIWCFFMSRQRVVRLIWSSRAVAATSPWLRASVATIISRSARSRAAATD